ncbi:Retrovirus-related Pol polyprotein from transposon TNT 1-94 [Glycine soja]|uniref:Retrovirus-related Pol polyprotein from transposon TNT 1-94 n=1 Tax=Glycine soja TaxID=3848 RepID=A0A445IJ22_GLYSO|nr:Retrovirus-related Pol polyprotein from transposon TNT 1-94 [Glycine soja]
MFHYPCTLSFSLAPSLLLSHVVSLKLQEEEREHHINFIPDISTINTDHIKVNKETLNMLHSLGINDIPGITQVDIVSIQQSFPFTRSIDESVMIVGSKIGVQFNVDEAILRSNATAIVVTNVYDIPLDLVNTSCNGFGFRDYKRVVDVLEIYLNEVERQLDKKVKVVRFDRGDEYYGRYDETGQHPDPSSPRLASSSPGPLNYFSLKEPTHLGEPVTSGDRLRHLYGTKIDLSINDNDQVSFSQAVSCDNPKKWLNAMKEEINSMEHNGIWDLVELPKGCKRFVCKWVFKTKHDSHGNLEGYKARLVAKGFTQKDDIDYKETFSLVSQKDSFRIIMALVTHYDLKLHKMDVKTVFLNGDLEENVYMDQPMGFLIEGKEHMVCKLKKSIYGFKQASQLWYLKFNDTIVSFGFKENIVDRCIYLKVSGSKVIFQIMYVDDILLATNDINLLHKTKKFLSSSFEMKDMGEASYVIGIEMFRN